MKETKTKSCKKLVLLCAGLPLLFNENMEDLRKKIGKDFENLLGP